jgi:tetratricopeptide (TPR) repeat protein
MKFIFACFSFGCLIFLNLGPIAAQDIEASKPGVVRIVNSKLQEQGSGFVVRVTPNEIDIVTASHVVSGAQFHDVYFSGESAALKGKVIDREEDALKGLALLSVPRSERKLAHLVSLELGKTSALKGGELVHAIGFPNGTSILTVTTGNVMRLEGRNLVFSGSIKAGSSGGPVLMKGLVIGLVTDILESHNSAVQAESVAQYIRGLGIRDDDRETGSEEEAAQHTDAGSQHWQRAMSAANLTISDSEMTEALREYKIAESLQPEIALYAINTGTVLNRLGRYEEAVIKLRRGVELDPKVAWFHNELCVALRRLKRFEEADSECLKAVRFDKNNALFQDELVRILEKNDQARARPN